MRFLSLKRVSWWPITPYHGWKSTYCMGVTLRVQGRSYVQTRSPGFHVVTIAFPQKNGAFFAHLLVRRRCASMFQFISASHQFRSCTAHGTCTCNSVKHGQYGNVQTRPGLLNSVRTFTFHSPPCPDFHIVWRSLNKTIAVITRQTSQAPDFTRVSVC